MRARDTRGMTGPALMLLERPQPRTAIEPLVAALTKALGLLVQSCTECTCSKAMVRDLDPDPDCPGIRDGGCATHSVLGAHLVLRDAGLNIPAGPRNQLRALVATAARDLMASDGFTDKALLAGLRKVLDPPRRRRRRPRRPSQRQDVAA